VRRINGSDLMKFRSCTRTLLVAVGSAAWLALVILSSGYSDGPSLFRTFALGFLAAVIAVPVGAILSWLVRHEGLIGRLARLAIVVLLFFPLFLHVSLWDAAFGKLGWLTSTQGQVLEPVVSGWTAAAWIHGIAAAPQVAVIFWLGHSLGTQSHEEQALLDASPLSVLLHVKARKVLSLTLLAMTWVIIGCSREIAVTDIYRIGTLAEQIYLGYSMGATGLVIGNWSSSQLRFASEFVLGPSLIPIGCFCLLFVFGFIQLSGQSGQDETWQPPRRIKPRGISLLLGISMWSILIIIPFANVVYRSGYIVRPMGGIATGGFEFEQLSRSFQRAVTEFGAEFCWSITIACVSATLVLVITISTAWFAVFNRIVRWTFILISAFTLAIPGPLIGTTIAALFSETQSSFLIWLYDRTVFAPVVANSVFCLPIACLLTWLLFSGTDRQTISSIQVDGGTSWSSFWELGVIRNAWPLSGIWLLIFALSFGELSASQLVVPPGIDTIPRLMLGLLHAGVDEMTAALTIVIAMIIVLLSLAANSLIFINSETANEYE
jgi:iron(III) transport system permease protein